MQQGKLCMIRDQIFVKGCILWRVSMLKNEKTNLSLWVGLSRLYVIWRSDPGSSFFHLYLNKKNNSGLSHRLSNLAHVFISNKDVIRFDLYEKWQSILVIKKSVYLCVWTKIPNADINGLKGLYTVICLQWLHESVILEKYFRFNISRMEALSLSIFCAYILNSWTAVFLLLLLFLIIIYKYVH